MADDNMAKIALSFIWGKIENPKDNDYIIDQDSLRLLEDAYKKSPPIWENIIKSIQSTKHVLNMNIKIYKDFRQFFTDVCIPYVLHHYSTEPWMNIYPPYIVPRPHNRQHKKRTI